jgi:hypothetical protein
MTLQKWAHISEIFGGIAIVVSLLVLIHEVRSNTFLQELQMSETRYLNYTDTYLESRELAEIYAKVKAIDGLEPLTAAYVDRYQLTPSEAVIWARNVQRTLWIWQSQFFFGGPSNELENEIRNVFEYPDLRMGYEINEDNLLGPEFIEYVNSIVYER